MKYLVGLFILLQIAPYLNAQKLLYNSDDYAITKDRIKQGNFSAFAKSDRELLSNYKSNFKIPAKRNIEIKFSINGLDNERGVGQNHLIRITGSGGKGVSPIIEFGQPDQYKPAPDGLGDFLTEDVDYTIRLDMRKVLDDLQTTGSYTTFDGKLISKSDFKGVYIAGNGYPLSWNFSSLAADSVFMLKDKNNSGIYEITLHFKKEYSPEEGKAEKSWTLTKDISFLPKLQTAYPIVDALYNRALEEMLQNVRTDGAFMAGEQWTGVWTRDVSYSTYLSLAIISPDVCKASLMAKVKNKRIIQDTGTGGSWPVSSDRMVWALAAWEIYAVTGDKDWLQQSFEIIQNSSNDDLKTVRSAKTGLFHGESSFLDWREQTYPRWADPVDIYSSACLGTNAVHYETFVILAKMAKELNQPAEKFMVISEALKESINRYFWMEDKGYYGQYLYGRTSPVLSPRSEALGEALAVLFDIASPDRQKKIIENVPVINFGAPVVFPNTPNLPAYHNNSVWPFVEAFWGLASAHAGNMKSTENAIASIYRASALFLTNKENFVASTGDYFGTEINSNRQLWSVAGELSTTFRIFFGMEFDSDGLVFAPCIPEAYEGDMTLKNFKYRNATLDISIKGTGNEIDIITLDGKVLPDAKVPGSISQGNHSVEILMKNKPAVKSKINLVENAFAPETPELKFDKRILKWNKTDRAEKYIIYKNGVKVAETQELYYVLEKSKDYTEYQIAAVDKYGYASFLSEPLVFNAEQNSIIIQAEAKSRQVQNIFPGYYGSGYIMTQKGEKIPPYFETDVKVSGVYKIDIRYSNGNGPITTDNKCAIRTLVHDKKDIGPIVMPQKGENSWDKWGYSNPVFVKLKKGKNIFTLEFRSTNNNMNIETNSALIDCMRLTLVK